MNLIYYVLILHKYINRIICRCIIRYNKFIIFIGLI